MRPFDLMLVRLKECLDVREDQEAADALGLTKGALSIRKSRDAFPIEPLKALADRDRRVDVSYVLTGVRAVVHGAKAADVGLIEEAVDIARNLPSESLDRWLAVGRALELDAVVNDRARLARRRAGAEATRVHEPKAEYATTPKTQRGRRS